MSVADADTIGRPRRSVLTFAMSAVTIDVVAERRDGSFCLYLVEEGPWPEDRSERLRALQKRLFDAVEAVAEGKLAERFPETKGKSVCIRLDCYDLPMGPVDALFAAFQDCLKSSPDWSPACRSLAFEISHRCLSEANERSGGDGGMTVQFHADRLRPAAPRHGRSANPKP